MPVIWSVAMIEDLRRMRDEDMSLLQIANELSRLHGVEVTRNMISGKVSRLGLEKKPTGRFARATPSPLPPSPPPPGEARTILSIGHGQCRWPLDEFRDGHMLFCGKRKAHGSFCEAHAERAWIKSRRI